MPENVLNCQNLQCPEPVIQVKRLIETGSPEKLTVIVDNEPALENVSRFLGAQGYTVSTQAESGIWRITGIHTAESVSSSGTSIEPGASPALERNNTQKQSDRQKILVLIAAPVLGAGDDGLGQRLMKNFLGTLPEMGESLWRIILLNGGVTLAASGSSAIEQLQKLEASGVSILVCGTCLEHFGLLAGKAVGQTTNMLDVVTSMQLADSVIRI